MRATTLISVSIPSFLLLVSTACSQSAGKSGEEIYMDSCAICHGKDLRGGGLAESLVDGEWQFGSTRDAIYYIIRDGIPDRGMPAYDKALSDEELTAITDFIIAKAPGGGGAGDQEPEAQAADGAFEPIRSYDNYQAEDYLLNVDVWIDGLEVPWGIQFTGPADALITELPGRLRVVENGELRGQAVQGTPEVLYSGQGGLMDVAIDPDYDENGWVYLAYSHALEELLRDRAMTRVVRGKIENNQWTNQEILYEAPHDTYLTTRHHYGCRIVFDPEGYLYFPIGDRGHRDHAQDLSLPNGKIHRIWPHGRVPETNPFVDREDALPTIFTYGNRNPQGMAVHPQTGAVWSSEHGPRGGDELNIIKKGNNYGWPVITYGKNYSGTVITERTHHPEMEQPVKYWTPSTAVCGINFYTGDEFPEWENNLFLANLADRDFRRLVIEDEEVP